MPSEALSNLSKGEKYEIIETNERRTGPVGEGLSKEPMGVFDVDRAKLFHGGVERCFDGDE